MPAVKVHLHEHERGKDVRCPFCHDELGAAEKWTCPSCGTVHHADCVKDNGRCAELGCKGHLGPQHEHHQVVVRATAPRVGPGWRSLLLPGFFGASFRGLFGRTVLVGVVAWPFAAYAGTTRTGAVLLSLPLLYAVLNALVRRRSS